MKQRLLSAAAAIVLAALLTACGGGAAGNLLANASPETSALTLYYYDGEQVFSRTLYDTEQVREIIDGLNRLPAEPLDSSALEGWSLPCYGLWIGGRDGMDNLAAWCGGVWLDQDGGIFRVDADFETLWQQLEGEDEEDGLTVLQFPNAGLLGRIDQRFLAYAGEAEPAGGEDPDQGIATLPLETYMTVQDVTGGIVTAVIDNQSGYDFEYSEYYALQKEIGGAWYALPITQTNVGFNDIAHILPDLEQATVRCDLTIFGELTPGRYRLVKDGLYAEFTLDE